MKTWKEFKSENEEQLIRDAEEYANKTGIKVNPDKEEEHKTDNILYPIISICSHHHRPAILHRILSNQIIYIQQTLHSKFFVTKIVSSVLRLIYPFLFSLYH